MVRKPDGTVSLLHAACVTAPYLDHVRVAGPPVAVQRGLRSRTDDMGGFSVARENGVHHFHSLYAEFMR